MRSRSHPAPWAAFLVAATLALAPGQGIAAEPPAAAPGEAGAAARPEARDAARAREREALFAALAAAASETEARAIEGAIWRYWMEAPSAEAQALLDRAMERRVAYDFAGAIEILDELVALAPDYAEGWNQRATVRFLRQEFDKSLDDVERVLALEPWHFGALAGKALILMGQGRHGLAQQTLRRAVEIDPWLRERALLVEIPEEKI